MTALTRRSLLVHGAAGAGLAALSPLGLANPTALGSKGLGTVLGPGRMQRDEDLIEVLSILDLDHPGSEPRRIELDFMGHGIARDPLDPNRITLFEKRGPGAAEIDLASGKVLRPITTHEEREFYGHGAFSPDGKLLYATESFPMDAYRGAVIVRDGETLEELGEFPTYGASPHDCVLRDDGNTLVITNGGGRMSHEDEPPCVTYVDVPSEKLIERVVVENTDVGAGHLALTERGDLALVSAGREWMARESLGAASLRPLGGELQTMDDPREVTTRMRGETLSVAIHEPSGVVGVTNPLGSLVTFWNLKRPSFVRSLDLAFPRGIAVSLDGSRFLISYGKGTNLLEVSTETLEPIAGSRRTGLDMQGSHIVVHRLA